MLLALDQTIDRFDTLFIWGWTLKWWVSPTTMGFPTKNDHFGVFWGYHHLKKHPYMCLLFVSVQALAESAVGNGGRGAHEGGVSRVNLSCCRVAFLVELSDYCALKCDWHDWISKWMPEDSYDTSFWVTNALWILVLCEQIVHSPLFLPGIDAKVCLFACKRYSCVIG